MKNYCGYEAHPVGCNCLNNQKKAGIKTTEFGNAIEDFSKNLKKSSESITQFVKSVFIEVPETRNPDERIRQRYLEILFMQPIEPKPGMFSFSDNGRTLNGMRFLRQKHYA